MRIWFETELFGLSSVETNIWSALAEVILTRSQAAARIADRTASQ